eukprot:7378901-Prymnesium_polylepis.2
MNSSAPHSRANFSFPGEREMAVTEQPSALANLIPITPSPPSPTMPTRLVPSAAPCFTSGSYIVTADPTSGSNKRTV